MRLVDKAILILLQMLLELDLLLLDLVVGEDDIIEFLILCQVALLLLDVGPVL
jgi:hypothetical protein